MEQTTRGLIKIKDNPALAHFARRIPVVNKDGMLEGMVATADILQRANVSSDETHDVFKKVSEPTDQASKPRAKMTKKAA